jgi:hypothetical protein
LEAEAERALLLDNLDYSDGEGEGRFEFHESRGAGGDFFRFRLNLNARVTLAIGVFGVLVRNPLLARSIEEAEDTGQRFVGFGRVGVRFPTTTVFGAVYPNGDLFLDRDPCALENEYEHLFRMNVDVDADFDIDLDDGGIIAAFVLPRLISRRLFAIRARFMFGVVGRLIRILRASVGG